MSYFSRKLSWIKRFCREKEISQNLSLTISHGRMEAEMTTFSHADTDK